jgi:hypothetical protein
MSTEADTYRKFAGAKLQAAGWNNDLHSLASQCYFTAGELQFTLPDVLKVPSITNYGNGNGGKAKGDISIFNPHAFPA